MKNFLSISKKTYIIFFTFFIMSISHADITSVRAFPNLQFSNPVEIVSPPDGNNRIFIVSQNGIIHTFENNEEVTESTIFLDISGKVLFGGEQGLLGLAFHPNFSDNGYFFINYTVSNPRRTVISRLTVSSDDINSADPQSELILLEYNQPYSNHNGGKIAFGPDGYLYISSGDGGSGGDPQNYSQSLTTLLGKILRIDIDNNDQFKNYSIPDDNPFKGNSDNYAEEIYAYGLRNVWKFSFDSSGRLWAADVGQGSWEEISLIINGGNYGWRIMEGNHCYNPSTDCDKTGLELPVWEYTHNSQGGYSITGGYVYEGSALPSLKDKYVYGDFVTGNIWAFDPSDQTNNFLTRFNGDISTFGISLENIYFASYSSGMIYRIVDDNINSADKLIDPEFSLMQNYPNPFNPSTTIRYSIPEFSGSPFSDAPNVKLTVHDVLGRKLTVLVDGRHNPGNYEVKFDPSGSGLNLSSGIYYYKLSAGGVTRTKKMILLK